VTDVRAEAGCSVFITERCINLSFYVEHKVLYFLCVYSKSSLCVELIVFVLDFCVHHKALGLPVTVRTPYTQMQSHALVTK
jgi:hypothetical protein